MASVDGLPSSHRVILDAGGILALSRGNGDARAALARARIEGFVVVIPTPVLAEVHRGGRDRAHIDRVVNKVDALLPTSEDVARRAGELLGASGTDDPVDAIVVAEALAAVPSVIITGDADDIRRLLQTQSDGPRVAVVSV
ncbi:MAG TPA: PIN domain-containing protein [Candidatus Sulfomarinibacteraceae bacterium]|nr:PIN domain-containing protein [Candidatus Sulfomarinibacteraceae bacterium]